MNKKIFMILIGLSFLLFILKIRICPFFNLFHIPCPGCGLTRSMILLFQGKWLESIRYNVLGIPLFVCCLIYLVAFIIKKNKYIDEFLFIHYHMVIVITTLIMIMVELINMNNVLLY